MSTLEMGFENLQVMLYYKVGILIPVPAVGGYLSSTGCIYGTLIVEYNIWISFEN